MKKQARRFVYLFMSLMLLATSMLGFSGPSPADTLLPSTTVAATPTSLNAVSKGTTILKGTWVFNCETGAEGSSGDIFWDQLTNTQRQMVPEGKAEIVNLGLVNFDAIDAARLAGYQYGAAPIPGNNDSTNQLVDNDVFAVLTNDGDYTKILVVSYGYNLSIKWVTYSPPSATTTLVTGVTLNKTTDTIAVGAADQLTATVAPKTATNQTLTWASSAPSVATVSSSGQVTGVAAGTANITAATTDGSNITAACAVTVAVLNTQSNEQLVVSAPATAVAGAPFSFTVTAGRITLQ